MTTWLPSEEPMDPGEVTTWINSGSELPDFERTDARGGPPTLKDPSEFESTGRIHKPRARRQKRRDGDSRPPTKPALRSRTPSPTKAPPKKKLPTPEPAPRRRNKLPTPEPAPRRGRNTSRGPTPEPAPPRRPESALPSRPEPAPPRHSHSDHDEPSITVPRPPAPPGRTPMPPAPRTASRSRQPAPPVPQPPPTTPDNWTPPPSERSLHGFPDSGEKATEIQDDFDDGFGNTPDVPRTVVSEDEGVDEVHPLARLPKDAPTVMRPDLLSYDREPVRARTPEPAPPPASPVLRPPSNVPTAETAHPAAEPVRTRKIKPAPPRFEQMPQGEPTVALPPPGKRNRSHMDPRHRDQTPEPVPEKLPGSASYSPPTEPANAAPKDVKSEVRAPRNRAVGKPPPPASGRRNTPVAAEARNMPASRASRLPKNAEVVPHGTGGVQGHHLVYGVVGGLGVLLVSLALFFGLVVLAFSP